MPQLLPSSHMQRHTSLPGTIPSGVGGGHLELANPGGPGRAQPRQIIIKMAIFWNPSPLAPWEVLQCDPPETRTTKVKFLFVSLVSLVSQQRTKGGKAAGPHRCPAHGGATTRTGGAGQPRSVSKAPREPLCWLTRRWAMRSEGIAYGCVPPASHPPVVSQLTPPSHTHARVAGESHDLPPCSNRSGPVTTRRTAFWGLPSNGLPHLTKKRPPLPKCMHTAP